MIDHDARNVAPKSLHRVERKNFCRRVATLSSIRIILRHS